jgi:hypothetical protein
MAMGTRKKRERQEDLWVVGSEIVGTPAHAFYDRLIVGSSGSRA